MGSKIMGLSTTMNEDANPEHIYCEPIQLREMSPKAQRKLNKAIGVANEGLGTLQLQRIKNMPPTTSTISSNASTRKISNEYDQLNRDAPFRGSSTINIFGTQGVHMKKKMIDQLSNIQNSREEPFSDKFARVVGMKPFWKTPECIFLSFHREKMDSLYYLKDQTEINQSIYHGIRLTLETPNKHYEASTKFSQKVKAVKAAIFKECEYAVYMGILPYIIGKKGHQFACEDLRNTSLRVLFKVRNTGGEVVIIDDFGSVYPNVDSWVAGNELESCSILHSGTDTIKLRSIHNYNKEFGVPVVKLSVSPAGKSCRRLVLLLDLICVATLSLSLALGLTLFYWTCANEECDLMKPTAITFGVGFGLTLSLMLLRAAVAWRSY